MIALLSGYPEISGGGKRLRLARDFALDPYSGTRIFSETSAIFRDPRSQLGAYVGSASICREMPLPHAAGLILAPGGASKDAWTTVFPNPRTRLLCPPTWRS